MGSTAFLQEMRMTGLYIHIPFCERKCAYCDFLSFTGDEDTKEAYTKALILEMEKASVYLNDKVSSVFIGGGTPTALSPEQLERIVLTIDKQFELTDMCEFSIEMNPGTLDLRLKDLLEKTRINRVSIGLQAVQDDLLRKLSRIHNYAQFLDTFSLVREAGIDNINVDLMFGLPDQTMEDWIASLDEIGRLGPEHISAYSLIIEEGTPFYQMKRNHKLALPDENLERDMYYKTKEVLETHGFIRYEVSNYAKEGFSCKHNSSYWQDQAYLGLGLGASSYIEGDRYSNTREMKEYLVHSGDLEMIRQLESSANQVRRLEERFFLGLRLTQGINLKKVKEEFLTIYPKVFDQIIDECIEGKLMIRQGDNIRLTDKGLDVSNSIFAKFLLEDD